jgi:hypothetical protein
MGKAATPNQKDADSKDNPLSNMMKGMGDGGGGGGDKSDKADPPANTDWSSYQYPDNHVFLSGQRGAGNIGNGLCTESNKSRSQEISQPGSGESYCQMLDEALNQPGSCANREMNDILAEAGPSGNGVGDLHQYCSTYSELSTGQQKSLVFVQVLATLITQESGWNAHATETPWTKNGAPMGGKGLFQIGVTDRGQDPDCYGLNAQSIYDPKTNIKCGACIALKNLAKDATMGHGTGDSGARGMARYFGPLRDMQSNKRTAMEGAVNMYCQANAGSGSGNTQLAALVGPASDTSK